MALFKKDNVIVTCPICVSRFDSSEKSAHWLTHVIPNPDHPGDFTWVCVCGPTNMTWPDAEAAAAGMALHMQSRHNIPA
jgi:hypothetical protein